MISRDYPLDDVFLVRVFWIVQIIQLLIIVVVVILDASEKLTTGALTDGTSLPTHLAAPLGSIVGLPFAGRFGIRAKIAAAPFSAGSPTIFHRIRHEILIVERWPRRKTGA